MGAQKYIGIENELSSFKNGSRVSFDDYFNSLLKTSDYNISGRSVRTETGHGFYVDGSEIEILTPPVQINKGFATRLTDLLMIGRDRVIKSTPDIEHTGYSMHWNITNGEGIEDTNFRGGVAVPFHLFGLTPLSLGLLVHSKDGGRYEIRGDSINNEDQINATALLLGAYAYAIQNERETPLKLDIDSVRGLFLPNGRFDEVTISVPKKDFSGKIQVQQYLELFYHWIKPFVNEFGTEGEIKNLEEFICGTKKLEFDNFKYYANLIDLDAKNDGVYLPITEDIKNPVHILKEGKERELPLEGRLLGEIVKQKRACISSMKWNNISFNDETVVDGIGGIYEFAQTLDKDLPKLERCKVEEIEPNEIEKIEPRTKILYKPENDNSGSLEGVPTISYYVRQRLRKSGFNKFVRQAIFSALLGSLVLYPSQCVNDKKDTYNKADDLVQKRILQSNNTPVQEDKTILEAIGNGKNHR